MSRVLPFIAFLIAIGTFFGYINPTYRGKIAELQNEIHNYDAALTAADRFKEKEAELTLQRNAISPDALTRLDAFLPDGVDNVQLILDLDALAARSGLELSNFDTAEAETRTDNQSGTIALESEDPIDSIELSMRGSGTYAAFRTFLDGIEKSLRPLDLVSLNVKSSETGVYTYDMTFRLYWLR